MESSVLVFRTWSSECMTRSLNNDNEDDNDVLSQVGYNACAWETEHSHSGDFLAPGHNQWGEQDAEIIGRRSRALNTHSLARCYLR